MQQQIQSTNSLAQDGGLGERSIGGCLFLARARASSAIAEGLQQTPHQPRSHPGTLLHAQHFLLMPRYGKIVNTVYLDDLFN